MKKKTLIALFGLAMALASGPAAWSQDPAYAEALAAFEVQAATQQAQANSKQDELARALYEAAKKNVYGKSYEKAIQQFQELRSQYAQSLYGQEGLYWLGYSLDKHAATLNDAKLKMDMKQQAIEQLNALLQKFPANAWVKDARILQVQIAEELVKSGLGKYRRYINGNLGSDHEAALAGVDEGVAGGVLGGVNAEALAGALASARGTLAGLNTRKQMDPDTELKLVALNALMGMDEEKAFPILEKMIREEKNPDLRSHALFILSQNDSSKVLPILVQVAEKDPSPEMRQTAIFWLGQRSDEASMTALLRIYDTADIKLKDNLIMAFAQSGNPKAAAKIIDIVKNEKDAEIRSKALFWYGQTEGEKSMPLLLEVFKSTDNAKIKQQIIMSLAQTESPKAISTLIEMARKETNFEIKKQLVFWIGQSDSPEALKFLEELIKK